MSESTEVQALRASIVLVCVDNDPEARMIRRLAEGLGISLVLSKQPHGARLEKEPDLVARIAATGKRVVWTVEIPGPATEAELVAAGYTVVFIDHHHENDLDRTHNPDGTLRRSSLEQFLALADVRDEEIVALGWNPRTVRGLGVLDDRYAKGLRDEGYTADEIEAVLNLRNVFKVELEPNFAAECAAAERAWRRRRTHGRYTVVISDDPSKVRAEVAIWTIRDGVDTQPLIIVEHKERALYVQNVDPETIKAIRAKMDPDRHVITFGAGRCLNMKNKKGKPHLTLAVLLAILDGLETLSVPQP